MIRLLLVDDHPVVRRGLRAFFADHEGVVVVGEASEGAEGVRLAGELRPDVVLMDLQLGAAMDGTEATRLVAALPGAPAVLVLTTYDSDADILAAIEAGATGYLLKDAPPEELLAAVRTAARHETYLTPPVASRLLGRMRSPTPAVSAREIEILELLARGLANKQISRELFISEATVKTHLVHIFGKLGVDSRTAAVTAALANGLIRRH